jgi:hypothetical protein
VRSSEHGLDERFGLFSPDEIVVGQGKVVISRCWRSHASTFVMSFSEEKFGDPKGSIHGNSRNILAVG